MPVAYQIIRSDRKTLSIQIKPDGQVVVRCPRRMPVDEIKGFVESKEAWIGKHLGKLPQTREPAFTTRQLETFRARTRALVESRAKHYAPIVGVNYNRITVRGQRSRWGSCSSKGNLNFNLLLALVPAEVLDYVVVHELCHRKEMNHSARFWAEVERVLPEYNLQRKWLKEQGGELIARL